MLHILEGDLKNYLEHMEKKELSSQVSSNTIRIHPKYSAGSPEYDSTARPTLLIRYEYNKSKIVLSWIYLISISQGIGTEILNIIINFCRRNNIKNFDIRSIHCSNEHMFNLGRKYGFTKVNSYEADFYHFTLSIKK